MAVLAALFAAGARSAAAETIRISGTGGAIGTIRILGDAFRNANPGIRVEILPGIGSSGSIRAVTAGRLDIGLSARSLDDGERALGIVQTEYARTPYVFCVNGSLRTTGLSLTEISAIYAGNRDWEDGRRIRLVLRPAEDSDIPVLKRMSPEMSAAVDIALRRKGMIIAMTDHDAAHVLETVPGAFGGTTPSLVLSEKRALRILSVDGIMPGVRTMAARSYPYSKTFFMVARKNPRASVRRFIDFVRSRAGAAVLAKNGQEAVRRERDSP